MAVSKEAERLDAMMKKVKGLLATADHPNTPPEMADNYRAQAERIMLKYKIEEEHLRESGGLIGDQFNIMFKEVNVYPLQSVFGSLYASLMAYAASHCGVFGVWTGYADGERIITLCGYESDIRYCESLYTQARLVFAARMEPKVDPNLSDEDNVYNLRSSGLERRKVAEMMGWVKGGAKVTRMYTAACKKRGEDPALVGQANLNDYRTMYAEGFRNTFWDNLWKARNAVDAEIKEGGLVLHGREERVKEAAYQRWPSLRPDTTPVKTGQAPSRVKYRAPSKADMKKMERRQRGAGAAGAAAGRRAANEININGQTPKRRLGE